MNLELKQQIIHHLLQVPDTTIWGVSIKNFINHLQLKTDDDLKKLVKEVQSQIRDGPILMETILGNSYQFFYTINI
jgi:hypothetical protein